MIINIEVLVDLGGLRGVAVSKESELQDNDEVVAPLWFISD